MTSPAGNNEFEKYLKWISQRRQGAKDAKNFTGIRMSGFSREYLTGNCHLDRRERSPKSMEISPFGRNDIVMFAAKAATEHNLESLCAFARENNGIFMIMELN
ncbi:MAG: hypothetical protein KJP10_02300 [Gammaproteobacteria bacterium]|nr:hypothetical protein [Gammaproteobacteria bacterium]